MKAPPDRAATPKKIQRFLSSILPFPLSPSSLPFFPAVWLLLPPNRRVTTRASRIEARRSRRLSLRLIETNGYRDFQSTAVYYQVMTASSVSVIALSAGADARINKRRLWEWISREGLSRVRPLADNFSPRRVMVPGINRLAEKLGSVGHGCTKGNISQSAVCSRRFADPRVYRINLSPGTLGRYDLIHFGALLSTLFPSRVSLLRFVGRFDRCNYQTNSPK